MIVLGIVLSVLTVLAWSWTCERMRRAEAIGEAIANPKNIDTGKLLEGIDSSFSAMPEAEKQKILNNPEAVNRQVCDATQKELGKSFGILFQLPASLREKIIKDSAMDILKKLETNPEGVDEFFDSPASDGAMKGASKFFLFELSGNQKAEAAPITEAMYEVVKRQTERKKGRK